MSNMGIVSVQYGYSLVVQYQVSNRTVSNTGTVFVWSNTGTVFVWLVSNTDTVLYGWWYQRSYQRSHQRCPYGYSFCMVGGTSVVPAVVLGGGERAS